MLFDIIEKLKFQMVLITNAKIRLLISTLIIDWLEFVMIKYTFMGKLILIMVRCFWNNCKFIPK